MSNMIAYIVIFVVGVFLSVLGFLLRRSLNQIDGNISKIFYLVDCQSKQFHEFKEEILRNYITKDECDKKGSMLWSGVDRRKH